MTSALLGLLALWWLPGGLKPVAVHVEQPNGQPLTSPIEVEAFVFPESNLKGETSAVFWPEEVAVAGRSATLAGRANFLLGTGHSWGVRCRDASRWCTPQKISPTEPFRALTLKAWPKIEIRGVVRPSRRGAMPSQLYVQGWDASESASPRFYFTTVTEVAASGAFSLPGPATSLDLRLTAGAPWGPLYRWDQAPMGRRLELGSLQLVAGASLSAFVVDAATGHVIEGADISWIPAVERAGTLLDSARFRQMRYTALSDARGLVQIHGITPGTYRLQVFSEGRGDLELGPYQIADAVALHLDEIFLQPLAKVQVQVWPPIDLDDRPWRVSIGKDSFTPRGQYFEEVTAEGKAMFEVPKGGRYVVSLRSQTSDAIFDQRPIEVQSDIEFDFEPSLIAIEGTITEAGEPLEAKIQIQGGSSQFGHFESDAEGIFQGWMGWEPEEDVYVLIQPMAHAFETRLKYPVSDRDGVQVVELDLPGRKLRGRVLDARNRPMSGARVSAGRQGVHGGSRTQSDAEGKYLLGLLPEGGPIRVGANLEAVGSAKATLADWGDGLGPETDLILSDLRSLEGVLTTAGGVPLVGATMYLSSGHFSNAQTTVEGRFHFDVLPPAEYGVLTVKMPGFPYWISCLPLPQSGPVKVQLPSDGHGGRLVLKFDEPRTSDGRHLLLVTADGGSSNMSLLLQWAGEQEGFASLEAIRAGRLEVPALAPGLYALALSHGGLAEDGSPCHFNPDLVSAWVRLENGGTAVLEASVP